GTPLATRIGGLLIEAGTHATALVSLTGLNDADAVARVAAAHGAHLLDMKQASESLVADYRARILAALALAGLALVATVWFALRAPRRVARVLLPMALTTLLVLAVLRGFGIELNLFHLVSLILAAGLGLDYALFFEHAGDDRDDQRRTLHSVLVCSAMTLLVFSLLALSSVPVLRAVGGTGALGVASAFVPPLLVARAPLGEYDADPKAAACAPWHHAPACRRRAWACSAASAGAAAKYPGPEAGDDPDRPRHHRSAGPAQACDVPVGRGAGLGRRAHPPARDQPPRPGAPAARRRRPARGAPVRVRRPGHGRARRAAGARNG